MSLGERRMAKAQLRQAELFADLLMRAQAEVRHVLGLVGGCIGAFARRRKVAVATPEWRSQ
jgi:hypothetical protein